MEQKVNQTALEETELQLQLLFNSSSYLLALSGLVIFTAFPTKKHLYHHDLSDQVHAVLFPIQINVIISYFNIPPLQNNFCQTNLPALRFTLQMPHYSCNLHLHYLTLLNI